MCGIRPGDPGETVTVAVVPGEGAVDGSLEDADSVGRVLRMFFRAGQGRRLGGQAGFVGRDNQLRAVACLQFQQEPADV